MSDLDRLEERLARSRQRLMTRAAGHSEFFDTLAQAVGDATLGGKRIRPLLVLRSYRATSGQLPNEQVVRLAAAIELLHSAFLVHDDVIDHDVLRRGKLNPIGRLRQVASDAGASAWEEQQLGDAAGILAGDLLLHECYRLIALAGFEPSRLEQVYELLDEAIYTSAAGELSDVEGSLTGALTSDQALTVSYQKTAVYSFSVPLRAGALLADSSPTTLDLLHAIGGQLGLAFQLSDDLVGAFGDDRAAGRASGADLREAKFTALVAAARQSAGWEAIDSRLLAARGGGGIAVIEAQRALAESGAVEAVTAVIHRNLADAVRLAAESSLPAAQQRLISSVAEEIAERLRPSTEPIEQCAT